MKKIIFLNLIPNTIGDTLFLTPLFKVIKNNFPDCHITTTVSNLNYTLLENNPHINEIIALDELGEISKDISKIKKLILYLKICRKLIKRFRNDKYDIAIIGQPNFIISQTIPFMAHIKTRVGYYYGNFFSKLLLTKYVNFTDPLKTKNLTVRHYLESSFDLLRVLELKIDYKDAKVEKVLTNEEKNLARKVLNKELVKRKFICIQAGAKWESIKWPREKYKELCSILSKKYKIVLLGSKREYSLNEYIKDGNNNIINLSGIDLCQVAAILKLSRLLVGNDSGLGHLAAAVGTSTVTIYGTSSYIHSRPLGSNKNIVISPNDKPAEKIYRGNSKVEYEEIINSISVNKVLSEVGKLI